MAFKLLLADDSLTIQKVIEFVLARENFEIKAVNDGEQALQALESFNPDIVLADIEMPKLNGYQLCEKIKSNKATAHIPVILLAGAFEEFNEEYAKSVSADDSIVKPFESQELISKVKSLVAIFTLSRRGEVSESSLSGWEEEIAVADDKIEEQALAGEEFAAEIAFPEGLAGAKGFEEELIEALKGEDELEVKKEELEERVLTEIELPSKEEIREILKKTVDEKISNMINNDVLPYISSIVKDSVETAVSNMVPDVIDNVARALMKDLLEPLRGEIDAAIKMIVPEVAEAIIKKEIEKITSEI
jgi:CheY-like chemotaxis protein